MVGTTPSDAEGSPLEPGSINGGLMLRDEQRTSPIVTIDVDDVDEALRKIGELGGTTVLPKQAVMEMGYAAYFTDSEGNVMGLWQDA
jgi:predicted enzyme related to lactoylglutathione lyase